MGCFEVGCFGVGRSNGEIRERFEKNHILKNEDRLKQLYELKKIINFADTKKGDLYVNLIHYDKNLKNEENMEYYRYFSINLIGSYYVFDDFDMLKLLISKLKEIPFSSSYILMTSGSESGKVLEEFNKVDFITEFIIFHKNGKYEHLKKNYNKIKLITNRFYEVKNFLESKKFSEEDLSMDNHLSLTPLITYYDYKKCLFPIHRILAYFFQFDKNDFSYKYFSIAKRFIEKSVFETETKEKILKIMEDLSNKKGEDFPKACINYYTGENLCYVFNKALRNFEKFYVEMAHFIGPFYFGLFNYALENPNKALNKKSTLYRDVTMERLDLYSYQFCEKDIICFPSFTSTTIKENLNFQPSHNAQNINNNAIEEKSHVKMIISYNPQGKCVPQGLDVSDESVYSNEKEVLLFPFTFLKLDKVELHSGKENDKHFIFMTIINRGDILEEAFNKNFSFKLVEDGTKIVVDKNNDLKCYDNELYYKMDFNYINNIEDVSCACNIF